jgi:hypothetical protein
MHILTLLTVRNYVAASLLLLLSALSSYGQTTWDFETGDLRGWTRTGTAFDRQPTYQDNVLPRQPTMAVNHHGDYWVGTFEDRPGAGTALGTTRGDAPQGTLTSDVFVVAGDQISLLLGGGRDLALVRAELLVRATDANRNRYENVREPDGELYSYPRVTLPDGQYYQIHANSGRDSERMERVNWPVRELQGEQARIRIVDESSGPWGHINVDDIRLDRGDSPPPITLGDVRVTGMEVTQVIQTFPGNDIPLIANKPTMVRVYVAGREDSRGWWEDISANLTVRRGRGGPQIGPVLRPNSGNTLRTITVSPGGSDRRRFDDSLNFILYPEQTTEGEIELEVQTFSVSRRAESDTDNNRLVGQFVFKTNPGFTFYCLSYGYTTGPDTTAPPFSDFEPHRVWALSALPAANLWAVPYPGYPRGNIAHRPVRNDDGSMGDAGYLDARDWAQRMIDRLEPGGGAWVVLMQPEVDPGYHGAHYVDGVGNHVINMQSNYADPGPTLTHEIGHGWGQPHTWQNPSFPYPEGGMGSQVGVRLFRFGTELLNSPGNHDIMSYAHPQWLSPYTYTEILRRMTGDRVRVPPAVRDARRQAAPDSLPQRRAHEPQLMEAAHGRTASTWQSKNLGKSQQYLYVSGWILPDGTATFLPFEMITLSEEVKGRQQGGDYVLTLEDANGKSLAENSFDRPVVEDDPVKDRFLFSMYVPMDMATSRITLRDKKGAVLTERKVSANSPKLSKIACKCEEPLTGKQVISWQASDLDDDPLTYSVWYSSNGGEKWIPLQIGLTDNSFEFDFDTLPGSDQAMIRVLASDGVNTTEVRSEQPIRVVNKSPQVTIAPLGGLRANAPPCDAGAGLDSKILVSEAQPLLLAGSAFDYEDGPVTDNTAFRWTSDKDGDLGAGSWIVLSKLSDGKHRITLTAYDSNQIAGQATTQITVGGNK